jgi:1-acyl-sn-glycerol-3-phosphate acyltransferase
VSNCNGVVAGGVFQDMDGHQIEPRRTQAELLERPEQGPIADAATAPAARAPDGAARQDPEGPTDGPRGDQTTNLSGYRERSLTKGVNPLFYWTLRALLVPFFLIYFCMRRIGREHLPRSGPLLLASNHRSFLDPFVIGTLVRRPVYYMAKRELFEKRWQAVLLNALGAFPVDRGAGDSSAMETARMILERGDCVVLFPEGTRVRSGPLGQPRRGVGRLALETGVPVAPVAVFGSEHVRRGWRIRPRKVCLRVGAPLRFPSPERTSPSLAAGVTERIWACVNLQWEWLGGVGWQRDEHERPSGKSARRRRANHRSSADEEARAA